jgi:mannose/cellobiose epimerase-like protein (N-acyl-D-glucosamine 2-epimerase family)
VRENTIKPKVQQWLREMSDHANNELLPFWLDRCRDSRFGGYITHFDASGKDTGEDEKSLIAQSRTLFSFSLAARHGFHTERCLDTAKHGFDFLSNILWDHEHEGFFWTVHRNGSIKCDKKILYGHSFAVYALSEFFLASEDRRALSLAERIFELIQNHASDLRYGGYYEMFERDWTLCGPGAGGGDRKTLDVHMHLMEAYTNLARCSGREVYRRRLQEIIDLLKDRMFRQETGTGIPQFTKDWTPAPQIKFDIVWGWDRFSDQGTKPNPLDNTSYGHNVEFAWLLLEALEVLEHDLHALDSLIGKSYQHALRYGIDPDYGGVFVEGSHNGPATDLEKEFWQQAELMNGSLAAYLHWRDERYLTAYENVHKFVMEKMINHEVGEWWPLLTRDGKPIWTHMSHSWKVNYHTVRAAVRCCGLLQQILKSV